MRKFNETLQTVWLAYSKAGKGWQATFPSKKRADEFIAKYGNECYVVQYNKGGR